MSGHTPGPWRALGFAVNADRDGLEGLTALGRAYQSRTGPLRVSKADAEANARLMAAAPDLLKVCTAFLACLGEGGYYPTAGKTLTERMRAAIAKAEGRQ